MYCLDDLCVWNKVLTDQKGTTYEVVKEYQDQGKEHPLTRCMFCNGYKYECKDYRILIEGKMKK